MQPLRPQRQKVQYNQHPNRHQIKPKQHLIPLLQHPKLLQTLKHIIQRPHTIHHYYTNTNPIKQIHSPILYLIRWIHHPYILLIRIIQRIKGHKEP